MATQTTTSTPDTMPSSLADWQKSVYRIGGQLLRHLWLILLAALVVMMAWTAFGHQTSSTVKVDPQNIFVSDNAHVLSQQTKAKIHQMNERYKNLPKKPQLMVITVNSLPAGQTIEDFTINQAQKLGVGDAAENSGVVYLIAKNQRQSRLEVGYGMEDQIPDAMTNRVTDGAVKADFARGDYDAGVQLVTKRLDQLIRTGEIQGSQEAAAASGWFFHPLQWIWTWLNTPHGDFSLVIALILIVLITYAAYRVGSDLVARVWLDELMQHYASALRQIDRALTPAEIFAQPLSAAVTAARTTLSQQLQPQDTQVQDESAALPDYFGMQFAFGDTPVKAFLASARNQDDTFKKTTMYQGHTQDWYGKLALTPKHRRQQQASRPVKEQVDGADVRPYLLNPAAKLWWRAVRWLANFWALLVLIALVGLFVWSRSQASRVSGIGIAEQLMALMLAVLKFFERLFANGQTPLQMLNSLTVAVVIFGVLGLGGTVLDSWSTTARRRVQLDGMIRQFLADVAAQLSAPVKPAEMTADLASGDADSSVMMAKAALKSKLTGQGSGQKKKRKRPDYFDMSFAFGSITPARFMTADANTDNYMETTMYMNHAKDWYFTSNNSSSSSDNDSFGGGSFGGGGGTSNW